MYVYIYVVYLQTTKYIVYSFCKMSSTLNPTESSRPYILCLYPLTYICTKTLKLFAQKSKQSLFSVSTLS